MRYPTVQDLHLHAALWYRKRCPKTTGHAVSVTAGACSRLVMWHRQRMRRSGRSMIRSFDSGASLCSRSSAPSHDMCLETSCTRLRRSNSFGRRTGSVARLPSNSGMARTNSHSCDEGEGQCHFAPLIMALPASQISVWRDEPVIFDVRTILPRESVDRSCTLAALLQYATLVAVMTGAVYLHTPSLSRLFMTFPHTPTPFSRNSTRL